MVLKILVYSDYVCPFCLLAKKPLDEAVQGKEVDVEWMPFELRPYPTPTLKPEGDYLQTAWQQSLYPMAERMGVPIKLPKVSPQPYTHLAFEGYQYAKEKGKAKKYNERILKAFFQEEQDIGEVAVLTKLAAEIGLDEVEYRAALESRKYREKHQQALQHAYEEAQISAVPTIVVGNRVLRGMHSKETIERVIEEQFRANKQ